MQVTRRAGFLTIILVNTHKFRSLQFVISPKQRIHATYYLTSIVTEVFMDITTLEKQHYRRRNKKIMADGDEHLKKLIGDLQVFRQDIHCLLSQEGRIIMGSHDNYPGPVCSLKPRYTHVSYYNFFRRK